MSDVHFMANDWALPKMSAFGVRCAGHEGAGVVVKVGKTVKGWNVGDRAGIKPIKDVCHNCEECWNGRECTPVQLNEARPGDWRLTGLFDRRKLLPWRHPHWINVCWHLPAIPYLSCHIYLTHSRRRQ